MDEYAVWCKEWTSDKKQTFEYMTLEELMESGADDFEEFYYFNYIGKTDVNDKKIYADSSIIEFEYLFNDGSNFKKIREQYVGYFFYDKDTLSHKIKAIQIDEGRKVLNKHGMSKVTYDYRVENLKIIGALQQDKHLLGETE